jgi:hypothetical protein
MPRPRFQFSIRWIFVVTAIVGVALAALSIERTWISSIVIQLIFLVMPGMVAALLFSGRGYARSFAMGAVAPTLIGFAIVVRFLVAQEWRFGGRSPGWRRLAELAFEQPWESDFLKILAIFIWSATLVGGTAAIVVRWLVSTTPK